MIELRDLIFAHRPSRSLTLDLYRPDGDAPPPVVVWIHGGAWRAGDKAPTRMKMLAEHGMAVASIQYRYSSEAIFPAQAIDCRDAIRWLRDNAAEYGIDAGRMVVAGASAGGHLAALIGAAGDANPFGPDDQSNTSAAVDGVVDFYGPIDFNVLVADTTGRIKHGHANAPECALIGGLIEDHPDRVALANPIEHLGASSPPYLLVHGTDDELVPIAQSRLFESALRSIGVPVELIELPGVRHGGAGFDTPELDRTVIAFCQRCLGIEPARGKAITIQR